MRSNVAERVFDPFPTLVAEACLCTFDANTQVFPLKFSIVAIPMVESSADDTEDRLNPTVFAVEATMFAAVPLPAIIVPKPEYPAVSTPPESPNCNETGLVPFVLTPSSITVILCTQDGMPVKSMLVPLVEATDVASV